MLPNVALGFTAVVLSFSIATTARASADAFAALPIVISEAARADVLRGDIYRRIDAVPGSEIREVIAVAVIEKDFSTVVDVVTDYESYPRFVPYLVESRVVGKSQNALDVFQRVAVPIFGDRHFRLRYAAASLTTVQTRRVATVRWDYIRGSGNIVASSGSWTLVQLGAARTLVCYRAAGDIGVPMPRWIVNVISRRAVPGVVKAFRARAAAVSNSR